MKENELPRGQRVELWVRRTLRNLTALASALELVWVGVEFATNLNNLDPRLNDWATLGLVGGMMVILQQVEIDKRLNKWGVEEEHTDPKAKAGVKPLKAPKTNMYHGVSKGRDPRKDNREFDDLDD